MDRWIDRGAGGQTDMQGPVMVVMVVFIIYTPRNVSLSTSSWRLVHMHTCTHAERQSRAGNDSPPPPGVEPSLSLLICVSPSFHSRSAVEAFQSFKLAAIPAGGSGDGSTSL